MTQTALKPPKSFKLIIRRLPRDLTEDDLKEQLEPMGSYWSFWFVKANKELIPHSYARAYIVFTSMGETQAFRKKFHNYVFVDKQGNESKAIVEMAFHQDVPSTFADAATTNDKRSGTLDERSDYKEFLAQYNNVVAKKITNFDDLVKEVEEKEKLLEEGQVQTTPLVEFLVKQHLEKENKKRARKERHNWREEEKEEDKKKRFTKDPQPLFPKKDKPEKRTDRKKEREPREELQKRVKEDRAEKEKNKEDKPKETRKERRERKVERDHKEPRQEKEPNDEKEHKEKRESTEYKEKKPRHERRSRKEKEEKEKPLKLLTKEKYKSDVLNEPQKDRLPSALVPDPKPHVAKPEKPKSERKEREKKEGGDQERKKRPERQIYRPARARAQPKTAE